MRKKRPSWLAFVGVAVAVAGLAILNVDGKVSSVSDTILGDLLTLAGALLFAAQIAWTDYAYSKQAIDYPNMTFWQILFAFVLFALYSAIFEHGHYSTIAFDPAYCIWRIAIISVGGTAFAYFSQSYAQKHLSTTETSLTLACESPIGAFVSIIAGVEEFMWNTVVGGTLVIAAVVIIELTPYLIAKRKAKREEQEELKTE